MKQAFLDGLKAWFSRYVHSFGDATGSGQPMELKEVHTAYVCRDIAILAESECLKGEDIVLAEAIGLLHDVGRFPQHAQYGTFKDSQSENHGDLGVRVIKEAGILEGLPEDEKAVILESVKFHNAYSVPAMGSRPALFLKLVRDADKLDIWRVFLDIFKIPEGQRPSIQSLGFPGGQGISAKVLEAVKSGKKISLAEAETENDYRLLQLAWIYDLNFQMSFRLALDRCIVDRIMAQMPDFEGKDALRAQLNECLREKSGIAGGAEE